MRTNDKKYIALQVAIKRNNGVVCEKYPDAFYPEDYGLESEAVRELESIAIKICRACPVQKLCLDYAISSSQRYGIWGGTLPSDR